MEAHPKAEEHVKAPEHHKAEGHHKDGEHHVAAEQHVDPWNVHGAVAEDGSVQAIDYKKLVDQFGSKLITRELLERFERVTGKKPHRFLRREIVFSERDLGMILDRYERVGTRYSRRRMAQGCGWGSG